METELFSALRERAEEEAIDVAKGTSDLLMAAPAGAKATMGLDPGLRTGVKVAVVNAWEKWSQPTPFSRMRPKPVG